jgi:molecular chaperone IbpA
MEDYEMRSYDLSPLFRSTVGFDRMSRLLDSAFQAEAPTYPPYNIEKSGDDTYRITMAVAGFGEEDLEVTQKGSDLLVRGKAQETGEEVRYLHRGIAARAFERHFELADHVNVVEANLVNGMLSIELKRDVPEALKPRTIGITASKASAAPATIEQQKAA